MRAGGAPRAGFGPIREVRLGSCETVPSCVRTEGLLTASGSLEKCGEGGGGRRRWSRRRRWRVSIYFSCSSMIAERGAYSDDNGGVK